MWAQAQGSTKQALLLSAAVVALLQSHLFLADHAVALGYMPKLLKQLSTRLPSTTSFQGDTTIIGINIVFLPILNSLDRPR